MPEKIDYEVKIVEAYLADDDMTKIITDRVTSIVLEGDENVKGENDIAERIKKYLDSEHQPSWNVFVGSNFGSCVTFETKRFAIMKAGHLDILIFKCG